MRLWRVLGDALDTLLHRGAIRSIPTSHLASQVRAMPADTQAPEGSLAAGLGKLNTVSMRQLGIAVLREHDQIPEGSAPG